MNRTDDGSMTEADRLARQLEHTLEAAGAKLSIGRKADGSVAVWVKDARGSYSRPVQLDEWLA